MEIRKYIVYLHLALNHVAIKLFGERYVDSLFWIREEVIEVVEARRQTRSETKKRDYLQILMDTQCEHVSGLDENERTDFHQMHLSKKLSTDEIKMNLSIFLMAGSESTSIAMTVLVYLMAIMPEEQEKLYEEIIDHFPPSSGVNKQLEKKNT